MITIYRSPTMYPERVENHEPVEWSKNRSPLTAHRLLITVYRSLSFNRHPKDSYLLELKDIDKRESDRLQGLLEVFAHEPVFLGMEEDVFGQKILVEAGINLFYEVEASGFQDPADL